jgi:nitrogenase molybdenum-iron protein NifN
MVYVSTPDFKDAFQDGWAKTVTRIIEGLVPFAENKGLRDARRINVLTGCHLTPGDIDELRDIIQDFGLVPTFLPDLSGSLDGHIPEDFTPTTLGGASLAEIKNMGSGGHSLHGRTNARRRQGVGEQSRHALHRLRSIDRARAERRIDELPRQDQRSACPD